MEPSKKQFYIIMGRSGSGKGTQADKLKDFLSGKGYPTVKHVTTGGGFRAFVAGPSYASAVARHVNDTGGLQPEFLAIWNWSNIFINDLGESDTIILDGAPRKIIEVDALDGALRFFGYEQATIIYVDVSERWAMEKLTSRGRSDDANKEDQARKMEWFLTDVLPCIEMYKNDERYRFVHVNGEQPIEDVHQQIIAKLEAQQN